MSEPSYEIDPHLYHFLVPRIEEAYRAGVQSVEADAVDYVRTNAIYGICAWAVVLSSCGWDLWIAITTGPWGCAKNVIIGAILITRTLVWNNCDIGIERVLLIDMIFWDVVTLQVESIMAGTIHTANNNTLLTVVGVAIATNCAKIPYQRMTVLMTGMCCIMSIYELERDMVPFSVLFVAYLANFLCLGRSEYIERVLYRRRMLSDTSYEGTRLWTGVIGGLASICVVGVDATSRSHIHHHVFVLYCTGVINGLLLILSDIYNPRAGVIADAAILVAGPVTGAVIAAGGDETYLEFDQTLIAYAALICAVCMCQERETAKVVVGRFAYLAILFAIPVVAGRCLMVTSILCMGSMVSIVQSRKCVDPRGATLSPGNVPPRLYGQPAEGRSS